MAFQKQNNLKFEIGVQCIQPYELTLLEQTYELLTPPDIPILQVFSVSKTQCSNMRALTTGNAQ
jgi:hypothetical protein